MGYIDSPVTLHVAGLHGLWDVLMHTGSETTDVYQHPVVRVTISTGGVPTRDVLSGSSGTTTDPTVQSLGQVHTP